MTAGAEARYTWEALLAGTERLRQSSDAELCVQPGGKTEHLAPKLDLLAWCGWTPADLRAVEAAWPDADIGLVAAWMLDSAGELARLGLTPVRVLDWLRLLYADPIGELTQFKRDGFEYASDRDENDLDGAFYVRAYLRTAGRDYAAAICAARAGVSPEVFAEYVTAAKGNAALAGIVVAAGLTLVEATTVSINDTERITCLRALAGLRGCPLPA